MTTATTTSPKPFGGIYPFVKDHLAVSNGVMLASGTLVAALIGFLDRRAYARVLFDLKTTKILAVTCSPV